MELNFYVSADIEHVNGPAETEDVLGEQLLDEMGSYLPAEFVTWDEGEYEIEWNCNDWRVNDGSIGILLTDAEMQAVYDAIKTSRRPVLTPIKRTLELFLPRKAA